MIDINKEVEAKRTQAIAWLTGTMSLLTQRDEASKAGDEAKAKFFAQAAAAAILSLDLLNSHVTISLLMEWLVDDFEKSKEVT